jgi:MFS family permease
MIPPRCLLYVFSTGVARYHTYQAFSSTNPSSLQLFPSSYLNSNHFPKYPGSLLLISVCPLLSPGTSLLFADGCLQVTQCGLILLVGQMLTILKAKWMLLAAIFFFELGSLLCAVATNMTFLICGRAVQGIGEFGTVFYDET